jgi:hypothetical protein
VTLTEHFDYLELAVTSAGDTTLVVEGPIGWWCVDDTNGLNPALFGQWAPGNYRVFVGTYSPGESLAYTIAITERTVTASLPPHELVIPPGTTVPTTMPPTRATRPPPIIPTPIAPPPPPPTGSGTTASVPGLDTVGFAANFETITLATGFLPDPQNLTGTSGGALQANPLGITGTGPCTGHIYQTPDHIMTLTTRFEFMRIDVVSVGDTTLVIRGPEGWWCNDDTIALNPRVSGPWIPGMYRIWVGSWNPGQAHSYTITFSEFY